MYRNPQSWSQAKPSRVRSRRLQEWDPSLTQSMPNNKEWTCLKGDPKRALLLLVWIFPSSLSCPTCLFTDGSSLAPGKNTSPKTALNPSSGLIDLSPPSQGRLLLMFSYAWKHVCDNFFDNFSFWNTQMTPGLSQGLGNPWTLQGVVTWWVSLSWGH